MWSITWRYLLAVIFVFILTAFASQQLALLLLVEQERYQPSAFWLLAALFAMLFSVVTPKGLAHVIFAKRLGFASQLWRGINQSFIALFLCLTIVGLFAQLILATELWGYYKLYFQPALLVLWPVVASYMLDKRHHENMQ
ncbi:hypothetical protein [Thalassotalea maritima]|uniref:hypothetical protein n=1 Tax=Thalassotalea maritima TaxID=3242416 RepID=UPI0035290DBD